MLGRRSEQRGLFEADNQYADFVGRDTLYGFLASQRGKLFRDEDFADLYCADNGRTSVPPSVLAMALVLQTHDRVSDGEAKNRADYDLRWKVALGIELEERPFAKSTLQLFRAQLVLDERARSVFRGSLEMAKASGFLRRRKKLHAALDTLSILGRGAVKDTYNLLSDGIAKLVRALAGQAQANLTGWAAEHGFERYLTGNVKGGAEAVDWDNEASRQRFLAGIVTDARRLLELAGAACSQSGKDSEAAQEIEQAAALLTQLLHQDIEYKGDEPHIKQGVAKDRIPSVHDPEMRHGRKSSTGRFNGHKGAVAVDTESQLITAVDVIPGCNGRGGISRQKGSATRTVGGRLSNIALPDCVSSACARRGTSGARRRCSNSSWPRRWPISPWLHGRRARSRLLVLVFCGGGSARWHGTACGSRLER